MIPRRIRAGSIRPSRNKGSSIVTTTFNTEMNKQIRELTADEMEAVTGGFPIIGAIIVAELGALGFMAGLAGGADAIDVKGAIARGHW
jgi:hypothetical protein